MVPQVELSSALGLYCLIFILCLQVVSKLEKILIEGNWHLPKAFQGSKDTEGDCSFFKFWLLELQRYCKYDPTFVPYFGTSYRVFFRLKAKLLPNKRFLVLR